MVNATRESNDDFRVLAGTAMQVAARLATSIIALAILAVLARTLPRDAFGRYSATIALFQVLDVFVDCGSLQAAVRLVARRPAAARSAVRNAVRFRIATACISIITAAVVSFGLGDPQVGFVGIAALSFFSHAAGVGVAVLHADIDYKQSESLRISGSLIGLLGTFLLVGFGRNDAGSMLIALSAGAAIANILLACSVKSNIPPSGERVEPGPFFREALALGIGGVIRQAYYSANPILARALAGDLEGARFTPAYRLCGFSILVSVYFSAAALPAMVRLAHSDRYELRRFFLRSMGLQIVAGSTIAGALFLFRNEIIILLFGPEYADSAAVLAPMCLTSVIIYVGGLTLTRLVAEGFDRIALLISAAGLLTNLAVNFSITPTAGAMGAAWASVATEATVTTGALAALFWTNRHGRSTVVPTAP